MSNQSSTKPESDDSFDLLFQEAESTDAFWISKAKLHFTEEMLFQMKSLSLSKGELAEKLGVKPAQITRLCSGQNNFTIETMVRVARALGCEFKSHLQPAGTTTQWIDFLKEEPVVGNSWNVVEGEFKTIAQEQYSKKVSHVLSSAA